MQIGVIGYGYWGPNLVRNFTEVENCTVKSIVEIRTDKHKEISKKHPTIKIISNCLDVINDPSIDAVVIATPISTHFELAKKALENGKHVLVEKPLTNSKILAEKLIEISLRQNKILMVDHTFLYTGAVAKMKELVSKGELGKINYIDSTRINLGLYQSDCNVLWDLAPHDISILNYLIEERPISINTTGRSHTNNGIENIAYVSLNYSSGLIAHLTCSWSSPVKIRTTLIGGDKKMIVYNDIEPSEKLKIYDSGISFSTDEDKKNILVDYRVGDVYIPKISNKEALLSVAQDFVTSINDNSLPLSNYQSGLDVVSIIEAANISLKSNGKLIKL